MRREEHYGTLAGNIREGGAASGEIEAISFPLPFTFLPSFLQSFFLLSVRRGLKECSEGQGIFFLFSTLRLISKN